MNLTPSLRRLLSSGVGSQKLRGLGAATTAEESIRRLLRIWDLGALGRAMVADTVRRNFALGLQLKARGIDESEETELPGCAKPAA